MLPRPPCYNANRRCPVLPGGVGYLIKPGLLSTGGPASSLAKHRPSLLPHQSKSDDSDNHKHQIAHGDHGLGVHRQAPFMKLPGRNGAPADIVADGTYKRQKLYQNAAAFRKATVLYLTLYYW